MANLVLGCLRDRDRTGSVGLTEANLTWPDRLNVADRVGRWVVWVTRSGMWDVLSSCPACGASEGGDVLALSFGGLRLSEIGRGFYCFMQ